MPQTDQPKQTVKLVDGEHGRRRIVDGRRQRLDRDIDQDAEGKGRILLDSAFGPERDRRPQLTVVDGAGAAIQPKQRFVGRHEVAHLGDEFDDPVGVPRLRDKSRQIHGEHDPRGTRVGDGPVRGCEACGTARRDAGAWLAPDIRSG